MTLSMSESSDTPQGSASVLDVALIRRAELHDTAKALTRCLEGASPGRESAWLSKTLSCFDEMRKAMAEHIETTESPEGIHAEVLVSQPRLANHVRRLVADHEVLRDRIEAAYALTARGVAHPDPAIVKAVRDDGTHIVALLNRHRQRSSDLIYEAYATDIGVGD